MIVKGLIIKGEQKASQYYDLPTANIDVAEPLAIDFGVYAGSATLDDASVHPCIICYSTRGANVRFEVHLFAWSGDLYGRHVSVEVGEKVSELVPFTGEAAMREKVLADVAQTKALLGIN